MNKTTIVLSLLALIGAIVSAEDQGTDPNDVLNSIQDTIQTNQVLLKKIWKTLGDYSEQQDESTPRGALTQGTIGDFFSSLFGRRNGEEVKPAVDMEKLNTIQNNLKQQQKVINRIWQVIDGSPVTNNPNTSM